MLTPLIVMEPLVDWLLVIHIGRCLMKHLWSSIRGTACLDCKNLDPMLVIMNADGPFVELGFKPALIIVKEISTQRWTLLDIERDKFNNTFRTLSPNQNMIKIVLNCLVQVDNMDMYSSGFKARNKTGTN